MWKYIKGHGFQIGCVLCVLYIISLGFVAEFVVRQEKEDNFMRGLLCGVVIADSVGSCEMTNEEAQVIIMMDSDSMYDHLFPDTTK